MFQSKGGTQINIDKLHKIVNKSKLPIVNKHMRGLLWLLDYPIWENGRELTPRTVINNPKKYPEHYNRILLADSDTYPIIIYKNHIVDGAHRVSKAFLDKKKTIKAIVINQDIYKKSMF